MRCVRDVRPIRWAWGERQCRMLADRLLCSVPLFLFRARESLPACLPCRCTTVLAVVRAVRCEHGAARDDVWTMTMGRRDSRELMDWRARAACPRSIAVLGSTHDRRASRAGTTEERRAREEQLCAFLRGSRSRTRRLASGWDARRSCHVGETDTMRTEKQRQ